MKKSDMDISHLSHQPRFHFHHIRASQLPRTKHISFFHLPQQAGRIFHQNESLSSHLRETASHSRTMGSWSKWSNNPVACLRSIRDAYPLHQRSEPEDFTARPAHNMSKQVLGVGLAPWSMRPFKRLWISESTLNLNDIVAVKNLRHEQNFHYIMINRNYCRSYRKKVKENVLDLSELHHAGKLPMSYILNLRVCLSVMIYSPSFRLFLCLIAASIIHLWPPPSSVLSTSLIKHLITGPGEWGIIRLGLYTCAHSDHSPSLAVWMPLLSLCFNVRSVDVWFANNRWCYLEASVRWMQFIIPHTTFGMGQLFAGGLCNNHQNVCCYSCHRTLPLFFSKETCLNRENLCWRTANLLISIGVRWRSLQWRSCWSNVAEQRDRGVSST